MVDRTVSDGKERAYDRCLDCRGQVRRIKTQVIVIIGMRVLMTVTTEVTEETEGESQFSVLPIPLTPSP